MTKDGFDKLFDDNADKLGNIKIRDTADKEAIGTLSRDSLTEKVKSLRRDIQDELKNVNTDDEIEDILDKLDTIEKIVENREVDDQKGFTSFRSSYSEGDSSSVITPHTDTWCHTSDRE